jgi:hypothetical protein
MDPPLLASFAAALLAVTAAFQAGLALGAPWGAAAYGGRAVADDGTLPPRYRVGSALAAVVLLGAMWVVLAAGSVLDRGPVSVRVLTVALWVLVAMFALNTLANARGRHPVERWGAGSVTALLTVLCALVAAT